MKPETLTGGHAGVAPTIVLTKLLFNGCYIDANGDSKEFL